MTVRGWQGKRGIVSAEGLQQARQVGHHTTQMRTSGPRRPASRAFSVDPGKVFSSAVSRRNRVLALLGRSAGLSAPVGAMYGIDRSLRGSTRRSQNRYVRGADTRAKKQPTTTKKPADVVDTGLQKKEFDIALSFAGEDREVADVLAALLKERGVRVFYDKYEQAQLWGKDLYQHLSHVYRNAAHFCVVLISKSYAEKLWTKHELRQAQARAFSEGVDYILPLRIDNTSLPGVLPTQSYVDLQRTPIQHVVNLILQKLKLPKDLLIPQENYGSPRIAYSTEMKEAQEIPSFYVVRKYDRIPYGKEKKNGSAQESDNLPERPAFSEGWRWLVWDGEGTGLDKGSRMAGIPGLSDGD